MTAVVISPRPRARPRPRVDGPLPQRVADRPVLAACAVAALALVLQTIGYAAGWAGHTGPMVVLWYVGFLLLCAPFALLLLAAGPTPQQRLLGSLAFMLLLYLSWLLANPVYAASFDESVHVTTLVDLTAGDGWFTPNALLPVSPHYPGLELAAGAVQWITGLPLVVCQVVVVAISRAVLTVGLFLLGTRFGQSARVGGLVVLLYAAGQQLYVFDAQFSYQTLALAMVVAVPLLLVRAYDAPRPGLSLLAVQACLATLVLTHHLTSWIVLAALWVVGLAQLGTGDRARARRTLFTVYVASVAAAAWTVVAVPLLVPYLGSAFGGAGEQVARLLTLDNGVSQVAVGPAGRPASSWEIGVVLGSAVLWCVLLAPALVAVLRGRTAAGTLLLRLVLLVGAAYPLTLIAWFSLDDSEVVQCVSTFVMLGAALAVALWLGSSRVAGVLRLRVAVPGALVMLLGGAVLGAGPDWQRDPAPYPVDANHRSLDADTLAVAAWAGRYLPDGSRFAADATLSRILPTVAPIDPVTSSVGPTDPVGPVDVSPLFLSTSITEADEVVRTGAVDFVVVDTRLLGEQLGPDTFLEGRRSGPATLRLDDAQIDKFADAPGYDLVLDGPIKVYDVRELRGERATFSGRADPGLPGDARPWQSALVLGLAALLALLFVGRTTTRRAEPGDAWLLAVTLPALAGLGVMATATGFSVARGVVVGVLLVIGGGLVALRATAPVLPSTTRTRSTTPSVAAVALVLLATTAFASWSAWNGLYDRPTLPAPPGANASSGGAR